MNCLEFRRRLGIDPQCSEVDFVQHRQECPRCAEACERALKFETSLLHALTIAPPPQLAESILLAQATGQQRQRMRYRRRGALLALAAAVVLAFGIGMHIEAQPLPALAVDHLNKEAEVLGMTAGVPDSDVREAFAYRGIALLGTVPAGISFVGCCPVGRYKSVHMVMPQADGPVTVLYLPDDSHEQRQDFAQAGWLGRSVPLAHGTLVLLAHNSDHFDHVENLWRSALQNPAATFNSGS
jgi:hypothetical protein